MGIQVIKERIFKINQEQQGQSSFVVCRDKKELLETVYKFSENMVVTGVTEIQKDGKTPRVAVMTDPYYKKLRAGKVKSESCGRLIMGRLYRITSRVESKVIFIVSECDRWVYEYVDKELKGTPVSVVEIKKNGKTPTLAVYAKDKNK